MRSPFSKITKQAVAVAVLMMLLAKPVASQLPVDTLLEVASIEVDADYATTDNIGNIYVLGKDQIVRKYGTDGSLLNTYSQTRFGNAGLLDVGNPLKMLVWYPDFSTVVWLDRNMASIGELNLIDAGFPDVRIIAQARDGNLWVYDETHFVLQKISPSGQLLFVSPQLNTYFSQTLRITCIREDASGVYAAEPALGILVFDAYAQFLRVVGIKGAAQFELEPGAIKYIQNDSLRTEFLAPFAPTGRQLPLPLNSDKYWLGHERLLVQTPGRLRILRWNNRY